MNNTLYLMQANEKVLKFNTRGQYEVLNDKLLPFSLKNKFKVEDDNMSIEERLDIRDHNRNIFNEFLSKRILNLSRENAKKLLNAYNFSQDVTDRTKAQIAVVCKAVSVTDSYWISDEKLKWEDVNPRKVKLNEIVTHIALKGSSFTLRGRPETPELTGHGAYAKAWVREENGLYLYKRGTEKHNNREIFAEISSSKIIDCFNVEHVKYELDKYEDVQVCKCKNMTTEELSIVDSEEIYTYCNRNNMDFLDFCLKIDKENIYKMCIIDYIISNTDRHGKNWGFYKNNKTGELVSCHPLFDHNNAFDIETMKSEEGAPSLIFQGKTQKEAAIYSMKKCNFKQVKELKREYFFDDETYNSVIERLNTLKIELNKELNTDYNYINCGYKR